MIVIFQFAIFIIFFALLAETFLAARETIRRYNGYYENNR
tara:strand:- start:3147 stop:3266 length:120 start_codon:yes stop_codon:yes gene_type:complete